MPPSRSATMALQDKKVSQAHRPIDAASLDIDHLLSAGEARDVAHERARKDWRQGEGVRQRKRARSPSTPRARSVSVDSEADVVTSQRYQVIRQARRIRMHWESGAAGPAPRQPAAPLGPRDVAALEEQKRRAAQESALRKEMISQRSPCDLPEFSDVSDEATLMTAVHDAAPQTPKHLVSGQFERSCAVDALAMGQGSQKTSPCQPAAQHDVVDDPLAVIAGAVVCDDNHFSPIGFSLCR